MRRHGTAHFCKKDVINAMILLKVLKKNQSTGVDTRSRPCRPTQFLLGCTELKDIGYEHEKSMSFRQKSAKIENIDKNNVI